LYIRILETVGLATVKKTPPKLAFGDIKPVADEKTLEALIANRYEVMAGYARGMRLACKNEIATLKARGDAAALGRHAAAASRASNAARTCANTARHHRGRPRHHHPLSRKP
jgi:stearoyl-CoA desaturase (delta-9 desaturase)